MEQRTCPIAIDPPDRPIERPYIAIRGPREEFEMVMRYLKYPLSTSASNLPAFTELPSLGDKILVLNLNNHSFYTTEEGLLIGEWARFRLPDETPALVLELIMEGKRFKKKEGKEEVSGWESNTNGCY